MYKRQAINPLSTSKMLTMREIASVMMMMALGPAPTQTIKIGPRATLGRAFKMTRYGSDTRERNFDHQSRLAISVPATVPSRKPTTVSKTVSYTHLDVYKRQGLGRPAAGHSHLYLRHPQAGRRPVHGSL